MNEKIRFSTADLNSAAWVKLMKWADQRLAELHLKNEGNLDAIETARLRGRIAELRNVMALGESLPPAG